MGRERSVRRGGARMPGGFFTRRLGAGRPICMVGACPRDGVVVVQEESGERDRGEEAGA